MDGKNIGTIVLRCSLHEAYGHMQRNVIIIVLMMALSFLAALLLTGRLQRGISERLLELADTARQVSGGKNFSSRAVTHGNDETGALIEAFNDMLVQIQSRDLELAGHRENLEQEVAVRTQEPTRANADLGAAKERAESLGAHEERVPGQHERFANSSVKPAPIFLSSP